MKIDVLGQNMKSTRKAFKQRSPVPRPLSLSFHFSALFSLLTALFSLFICSCHNPSVAENSAVVKIPPGMGSFSLALSSPRTVLPTTPIDLADFDKLELAFTAVDGGAVSDAKTIDPYDHSPSLPAVFLQPGRYSLTVTAYTGGVPVAGGTLSPVVIEPGENTPGAVTLKALLTGGTGTFSWNITVPASVISASMKINPLSPGGTAEQAVPLTISGGKAVSSDMPLTLNSGYYNITLTLETAGGLLLEWFELLHIYSTLESEFTKTFTDNHFINTSYTVTFESNGGTSVAVQSVEHGGTIPAAIQEFIPEKTADAYLYSGTPPETPGFAFAGWYKESTLTNQWNSGSPVIGSITVYAKWNSTHIDVYSRPEATDFERAIAYVNATPGSAYTLFVNADVIVGRQTLQNNNTNVTIKGFGGMRNINLSPTVYNNLFTVGSGGTADNIELIIGENITLEGHGFNTNAVVKVQYGAKFTMLDGSKITGNTNTNTNTASPIQDYCAAAVCVYGDASVSTVFTMEGGEISGNTSVVNGTSSVYVYTYGTFIMNGGSINGNTAQYGDVSIDYGASPFIISGDAVIGSLSLITNTSSPTSAPAINIASGWSGSVGRLNLVRNESMANIISFWKDKEILKAASGHTLTSSDVAKVTLGNFISSSYDAVTQPITDPDLPDAPLGYHISSANDANIGKLVKRLFDLYAEVAAFNVGTTDKIIEIPENITLDSRNLSITNTSNTLTIRSVASGPYSVMRGQADTVTYSALFVMDSGAKLVFADIVIDGKKDIYTDNAAPLVRVNAGGEFTLNSGAELTNNRAAIGGGVYVNNGGTFTMSGSAKVSGNTATNDGGGVGVSGSTSTFAMTGNAEVSGNTANNGGGVYVSGMINGDSGYFIMSDNAVVTDNEANNGGGVYVFNRGVFTMSGNASVSGNTANTGGGVYVTINSNSGGTFIMEGGEVSDNQATSNGGGVYVDGSTSTFTMSGSAKVSGNTATSNGGGVFVLGASTFTMTGGTIGGTGSGNTATNGGGVSVAGGSFSMSGSAKVSGNEATGTSIGGGGVNVSNSTSTFAMAGNAEVSGNTAINGGGVLVYNGGTFTMSGGEMSGNKATGTGTTDGGGGVHIGSTGTFTMTGGTIGGTGAGNTAVRGGGAFVNGGNFTMSGSAVMSNNEATGTGGTNGGGGVYITGSTSTFTMTGGTIGGTGAGNTATNNGGGVYVTGGSIFNMSGGAKVLGNTAATNGGGVYLNSTFTVGGTAVVSGNTVTASTTLSNVHLINGRYITLGADDNAPQNGMNIYVRTATASGVIVDSGANQNHAQYFHADDEANKIVALQSGDKLALVDKYYPRIISFDFTLPEHAPQLQDVTIYRSNNSALRPDEVILTADDPDQYSSIEWWYNNIRLSNTKSLTLSATDILYNMVGEKFLTVEVVRDGVPYSRVIKFTVVQ